MKYYYSIASVFYNEKRYLKEWLDVNLAIGCEHFYLYDNLSTDNPLEVLQPYIDAGLVTYIVWPVSGIAQNRHNFEKYKVHLAQNYSQEAYWAAFMDIDEFLYSPDINTDIKQQLKKYENYPAIAVNWLCYGDNGIEKYDERNVTEKFFRRSSETEGINLHVKVVAKCSEIVDCHHPHFLIYKDGKLAVNEIFEPVEGAFTKTVNVNVFRINHYNTKSKEEFFNFKYTKPEGRSPDPVYYQNYNLICNSVEDRSIYRFLNINNQTNNNNHIENLYDLIPTEKDGLHSVGINDINHYIEVGKNFLKYFKELVNLQSSETILDIGSGTGRISAPLVSFLKEGEYHGVDIVKESIEWCNKKYSLHAPNFKFYHLDIYNKLYNPNGKYKASEYCFPFEDNKFDFIFLTSVFTHMLPNDIENYMREISRMLKSDGRCLITYFINNKESYEKIITEKTDLHFKHELEEVRIINKEIPEAAVCYKEEKIRELYKSCGLEIVEPIHFGSWSSRTDFLSYQDIIIAKK